MRRLAIAVVCLVLIAGCSAPPPASAPNLSNTSWMVVKIGETPTLPQHLPSIGFDSSRFSGSTGCNSFGGDFTQSGASISFKSVVVTEMACLDSALMVQETNLLAALPQVVSVSASGAGVTLLDGSGHPLLSLAVTSTPSPAALIGPTWKLTSILAGQTATSAVADSTVTLVLSDLSYTGKACNSFGGDLAVTGSQIVFGGPRSTNKACPTSALTAQESTVLAILAKVTQWRITASSLTLSAPDGSGLEFTAS